jgi:hypothetical protein
MNSKLLISLATGALLAGAPAASSTAQARPMHCPTTAQVPYSSYQGPDGTYDSEADFVRDLRGIPCGITCTRAAQARWARWAHNHCVG